jgi:hypothetical protein
MPFFVPAYAHGVPSIYRQGLLVATVCPKRGFEIHCSLAIDAEGLNLARAAWRRRRWMDGASVAAGTVGQSCAASVPNR